MMIMAKNNPVQDGFPVQGIEGFPVHDVGIEGFDVEYFPLEGNLCVREEKWRWIDWLTWTYYYAILRVKSN